MNSHSFYISIFLQSTDTSNWFTNPGVLGTMFLILFVLVIAVLILTQRVFGYVEKNRIKKELKDKSILAKELMSLDTEEIDHILQARKEALDYKLEGTELGSAQTVVQDRKGIVKEWVNDPGFPLVDEKKHSRVNLEVSPFLRRIVLMFIGSAIFWLLFGTLVGQYLGMKFFWADLDHISWLSFGRLRPVHTNTVFWGWSSQAIVGLAYFVISRTSNTEIYSKKLAYASWISFNLAVLLGNFFLMAGINNGGGEYREYIWPAALFFFLGLFLTFINFYKTVSRRKMSDIYISNWYIIAGMIWTMVLLIIGYLPFYQDGLGETVIAGYYMHQGVGMWFMTTTLGLIYYYLPSSLNKPIYSYSLGVLAFWTQMLFYTMIGTHHFVFSPLPWWLQTVAIIYSVGMFIPVFAGTANFALTMRGSFHEISRSYVLPFFIVGVTFYLVGSSQGSFQAMRFTNFIWHFTDFNVAHSHMTMYGIIAFILWACTYAIVPKITNRAPSQLMVGAHFWIAFLGLTLYMMSLMVGGSLRGLSWVEQNPFIESVILMKPYWVWRAVGGTMMFVSHIIFAINFINMIPKKEAKLDKIDIKNLLKTESHV
ncbi:MAG: cbb3-type cytochrome c oxidase subunit I [Flavobacteriaceae bacterium]|nr:cbb3-type cytochrome c oxidase subunit I [Flavobacteriaceae bacterium]